MAVRAVPVSGARNIFPVVGPDGGGGGDGADVALIGYEGINTLADFRMTRKYQAENGEAGAKRNCTGKSGYILEVPVPCGTRVIENDTGELIGDITGHGDRLIVAGWRHCGGYIISRAV